MKTEEEIELEYLNALTVQEKVTMLLYLDDMIRNLEAVAADIRSQFRYSHNTIREEPRHTDRRILKLKKRFALLKELLDNDKE